MNEKEKKRLLKALGYKIAKDGTIKEEECRKEGYLRKNVYVGQIREGTIWLDYSFGDCLEEPKIRATNELRKILEAGGIEYREFSKRENVIKMVQNKSKDLIKLLKE